MPYSEYETYLSALRDEEQRRHLIRFAQRLIQWRHLDAVNRINLFVRRPVFGEDCRRSVKVNLLFSDVFDAKRTKNLDRSELINAEQLDQAPSTIFNPCYRPQAAPVRNFVEDWPETGQAEIEAAFGQPSATGIREVPLSLQLSNKKRRQALKKELLLQKQQQLALEEAERRAAQERRAQEAAALQIMQA